MIYLAYDFEYINKEKLGELLSLQDKTIFLIGGFIKYFKNCEKSNIKKL